MRLRTKYYNANAKSFCVAQVVWRMIRKLLLKLLWLYQHSLSLAGWGSCRFYPSCSEYAKWQFEHNPLYYAFYKSATRILRCNQLFEGGIDYPQLHRVSLKPQSIALDAIKYWLVPGQNNRFSIIKNFHFKGTPC